MAQTDRQTDNKGTWWSITEYQPEYQDVLKDATKWPDWVKKVYGGLEQCPTTQKIHFQGAIQAVRQVRFRSVQDFLPKAHIELARQADSLRKYVMKAETAVGDKLEVSNSREYWSMERSMCELAVYVGEYEEFSITLRERGCEPPKCLGKEEYWFCVRKILRLQPFRAATFAQPQMEKFWINTRQVWVDPQARALVLQPSRSQEGEELPGL